MGEWVTEAEASHFI